MSDEAIVRVAPINPGSWWPALGVDIERGVFPSALDMAWNAWGSDTLTFNLDRRGSVYYADILPFTPIEVEIAGITVWSGFVSAQTTPDNFVRVEARGAQYYLDMDTYQKPYLATRTSRWKDQRTNLAEYATGTPWVRSDWGVSVTPGALKITASKATARLAGGDAGGVVLDAGPGNTWTRATIAWTRVGASNASLEMFIRGTPDGKIQASAANDSTTPILLSTASGTTTWTGTASRYLHVFVYSLAVNTPADDNGISVSSIQVWTNANYDPAVLASGLRSDIVQKDALTFSTGLSSDVSTIAAGSFQIPELVMDQPSTPREMIALANAYEDMIVWVDPRRRLNAAARPAAPAFTATLSRAFVLADSGISSDDVVSTAKLWALDAFGNAIQSTATVTSAARNFAQRAGIVKSINIGGNMSLTQAAADRITSVYLAQKQKVGLKGSATIGVGGVRDYLTGVAVHPAHVMLGVGQLVRITDQTDPESGLMGRDGRIVGGRYAHDTRTLTVDFDSTRASFEALMERFGAVVSAKIGA